MPSFLIGLSSVARATRSLGACAAMLSLALAATLGATPPVAMALDDCSFVLGFATLQALLPAQVGACLDDQQSDPATGDATQHTTGGLLVWRKADNWTAFTDGDRTWIDGPFGLQARRNVERLTWESNGGHLPLVPAPAPGERCHTGGLDLSLVSTEAGAGNVFATYRLTNWTAMPCTAFGYPGAQLLDPSGAALPTTVVRGGGQLSNEPGPARVVLPPGGRAFFRLHWNQVPVGSETVCPAAGFLAVTPPDEVASLVVPADIRACGGGRLDSGPVRPDGPGAT